jgi:polyisoprenoid-binding protein YceI
MKYHTLMPILVMAVLIGGFAGCNPDPAEKVAAVDVVHGAAQTVDMPDEDLDAANVTVYSIIADESSIDWEGSKVTETHIGGFAEFDGTVTVPDGDLERARVNLTVQMDSLYSDAGGLTEVMKDPKFFDVENHPVATFKSTQIKKTDKAGEYMVRGDFMLNGVTNNIGFLAEITVDDDTLHTESEFSVKRQDWNVVYQGFGDDFIREKAIIRFDVMAKAQ